MVVAVTLVDVAMTLAVVAVTFVVGGKIGGCRGLKLVVYKI